MSKEDLTDSVMIYSARIPIKFQNKKEPQPLPSLTDIVPRINFDELFSKQKEPVRVFIDKFRAKIKAYDCEHIAKGKIESLILDSLLEMREEIGENNR